MFTESSLQEEVKKIFGSDNRVASNYRVSLIFHTLMQDIEVTSVIKFSEMSDYANNISDKLGVVVLMHPLDYVEKLQPAKAILEATLKMIPVSAEGEDVIGSNSVAMQRFRARLPEEPQSTINGDVTANLVENTRATTGHIEVSVELNNLLVERLRAVDVGDTYGPITPPNLLKLLMDLWSRDGSGDYDFAGVDMVPAKNDQLRDNLVIPHGIRLVDLPGFIHEHCGGVYSAGIGWYLTKRHWYIYPLYDHTRFDVEKMTLTVIICNSATYPIIQKSYRYVNNSLTILSNKDPSVYDDTESKQQNEGSGVRFVDSNKLFNGLGKYDGNKYTIDQRENVSEFTTYGRDSKDTIAPIAKSVIHNNPLNEYSRLARNNTVHFTLTWEQSDASLLYPGMPVRMVYWNGSRVKEIRGTLLGKAVETLRAGNVTSSQFIQVTALTVAAPKVV